MSLGFAKDTNNLQSSVFFLPKSADAYPRRLVRCSPAIQVFNCYGFLNKPFILCMIEWMILYLVKHTALMIWYAGSKRISLKIVRDRQVVLSKLLVTKRAACLWTVSREFTCPLVFGFHAAAAEYSSFGLTNAWYARAFTSRGQDDLRSTPRVPRAMAVIAWTWSWSF